MDNKKVIALKIHEGDNVAVVLEDVKRGQRVQCGDREIIANSGIGRGHKIALTDIDMGEKVIKYSFPIGYAIENISEGEHVHIHNTKTTLEGIVEYTYNPAEPSLEKQSESISNEYIQINSSGTDNNSRNLESTFNGYVRADGRVGIRNEIWIVNTVGCMNKTAEVLAREASTKYAGKTDGIFAYTHPYGCSQMGEDEQNTQKYLPVW